MDEQVFSDIWYASDEHFNKRGAVQAGAPYEDKGFLAVAPGRLEFRGLEGIVQIPNVQALELLQKKLATTTRLALFLAGGLFAFCGLCGGIGFAGVLLGEEEVALGGTVIGFFLLGLVTLLIAGFLVWLGRNATPWVKVTYLDGQGQAAEVYLADGRMFGWRGIAGGTKQLHEQLREVLG